tara:strand:+ start:164 stop:916 length:753 start_codon:yes stop_codon:yes gene_type:complete
MKIIKVLFFFIFLNFYGCAEYEKKRISKNINKIYFSSNGFALIYDDYLFEDKIINKKINNDEIIVLHSSLKKNTPVRITNLENSIYIDSKIFKKASYPKIFNVVLSKKAASILKLDHENPLIEIIELKKNKKFIAKEGNTFEEEKIVADKAPVDEIKMDVLNTSEINKESKKSKKRKFILVISDFYYKDTATELKNDLIEKTNLNNISIRKINNNKFRLLVGPFENFNALKNTYISLNNLGFEELNVYNE